MEDFIDDNRRRFDFQEGTGKLRLFQSSDDTIWTSMTDSGVVQTCKNDCVFILDPEKEEIIRYNFNKKGRVAGKTACKFVLQNGSLKKWGGYSSQNPNLNSYAFYNEAMKKDVIGRETLTYYVNYSPEELKSFVNNIFQNLTKPSFEMTTIIRFFRDGRKKNDKEKIKSNIYKYVLLPNKIYDNFELPTESEIKDLETIKTKNSIIFEDHTKHYPPKEYSLDAKERFKQNWDCFKVYWGTTFYGEYLAAKNCFSIKSLLQKTSELTFKEFLLKNRTKKLKKSHMYAEENAYGTFQEEYEKNKMTYLENLDGKKLTEEEYIDELEAVLSPRL